MLTMIRDIRGRFAGKELSPDEYKRCPANCPCPEDFAIRCIRNDEMDCCEFGIIPLRPREQPQATKIPGDHCDRKRTT